MGDKFTPIENGEAMSNDKAIAECLNSHFVKITDSLGRHLSFKRIDMAIDKYKSQPNITAIKRKVKVCEQFEFGNVDLFNTMRKKYKAIDSRKANNGDIPIPILQDTQEMICPYLTICIKI